jgi:prepilin-type N-terminal cleavage/methylation domain-containing protein
MKRYQSGRLQRGFTLLEVMIVVAIIAMLAVVAVPSYLRARKRNQAVRVLDGARALEQAINLYTVENNLPGSQVIGPGDVSYFVPYLKTGSELATSLPNDLLGNPYVMTTLDGVPKVSSTTFNALSDVAPAEFWKPYYP